MEGVVVIGVGIGVLVLYELSKQAPDGDGGLPPDPNAPFKKDFQPTNPVIWKINPPTLLQPPPPKGTSPPPPAPSWQISADSYPSPMCGIQILRKTGTGSTGISGMAWAPEMGPFDTKEKCLQNPDAMTAAQPYLASWKGAREPYWGVGPGDTSAYSPLIFDTGKAYDPSNPESGCFYIDKPTGNLVKSACMYHIPMGLPSTWNDFANGH